MAKRRARVVEEIKQKANLNLSANNRGFVPHRDYIPPPARLHLNDVSENDVRIDKFRDNKPHLKEAVLKNDFSRGL